MKHVEILYLLLFCLTIEQQALAQTAAADNELKQLQEDMYRYFSTNEVDKFNDAVEKLKAAALGHNPPVLGLQFLEVEPNAPLGLWSGLEYIGEHIEDIRHQRLFLYTDGLNEAEDVWHNQFGDDNIPLILEEHPAFSCQQTIDVMKQAVADHAGNAEPSDDLTMLCVKVMG